MSGSHTVKSCKTLLTQHFTDFFAYQVIYYLMPIKKKMFAEENILVNNGVS